MARHSTKEAQMRHLRKITAGAAAVVAVAGGGAAIAANQTSPKQESQAVVNDAASQLGVSADKLTAALKQALKNRVDAAVKAGRLTQAQGAELKQRIDSGEIPLLGVGGPGFHRHFGPGHGRSDELAVAASYLGVSQASLRTSLEGGNTLAQVAKSEGKSVDGLVAALVKAEKQEWADAVKAGRMTAAQRDAMLPGLEQRMTDLVNGTDGPGGHGLGPPPPGAFGAVVTLPDGGTAA
jgi:hypothetical protein